MNIKFGSLECLKKRRILLYTLPSPNLPFLPSSVLSSFFSISMSAECLIAFSSRHILTCGHKITHCEETAFFSLPTVYVLLPFSALRCSYAIVRTFLCSLHFLSSIHPPLQPSPGILSLGKVMCSADRPKNSLVSTVGQIKYRCIITPPN